MRLSPRSVLPPLIGTGFLLTYAAFADPSITSVTAQQRHPWDGKVDISYTASGIDTMVQEQGLAIDFKVTATDRETGTSYTATFLSGDMGLADGTHSLVWDMAAQGLSLISTNVVFSVSFETTPGMYCVIDLSAGDTASSYPVTYFVEPPSDGFNVQEYKTTKLVLKRIEAGSFQMGDSKVDVTLTKPFFLGLFEMTQKQYSLVTGNDPSYYHVYDGDRPVDRVSYEAIRGSSNGEQWPASNAVDADSFLGKLRTRTGLDFDLPTEAQWEYACRAGTTTKYSYGDSPSTSYMKYSPPSSAAQSPLVVGSLRPNPWGVYDMHGNVNEWCLDWYASDLAGGTDPKGSSSGSSRVQRGGNWTTGCGAAGCTSSSRANADPSSMSSVCGFRLSRIFNTIAQSGTYSGSSEPTTMGPSISRVTAQQRYPWNGKVDISYTVFDIDIIARKQGLATELKVTATDQETGTSYTAMSLSGDTGLADGTHTLVWDMDAQGLTLKSTNVVFSVSCETTPASYCVIDLSAGPDASSYPVTYLAEPPSGGFNVDEYKTTKLVLKRIEAGTFIMGENQSDEAHRVTLTKPFFMGLFEMTQKQYQLVTGGTPSHFPGDTLPVDTVSYNSIRGSTNGSQWPSSNAVDDDSFLGKLQARTGLDFDLPTEAQWEYACRAGTATTYSYGNSADGNYMWYGSNSSSKTHEAGTKLPNPWGLYDMHGNVDEWCLDWHNSNLGGGTDPKGPSSGSYTGSKRVTRGGSWNSSTLDSASRFSEYPSSSFNNPYTFVYLYTHGFRLSWNLTEDAQSGMLCSGENAPTIVDLSTETRTAALSETIRYSTVWETDASGAEAVIAVNGEMVNTASGSGVFTWLPVRNGTYTLTHRVMKDGQQIGTTLTTTFEVVHIAPRALIISVK